MAQLIVCPKCERKLQVPDAFVGQAVQCPECQHTFSVSETSVSAEPKPVTPRATANDADDEPRRRRYDEDLDDDDDVPPIRRRSGAEVPNYLVQSILVTLCCCMPFGIAAIVNSAKVNGLLASGDYEEAVRASEAAQKWCWISFVLGIIANGLYIAVQIMAEGRHF